MRGKGEGAVYFDETIKPVSPNKPSTPQTPFRIPLDLKRAAAEKAARESRTLTSVVLEALREYVSKP